MANKRAAIYRRVSSEEQEDNYSLGSQDKECRALCEQSGYTVVADEADAHTGYKLNRRGLQAIRALVRTGELDVLVIWKLDRLSRRMWHVPELLGECEENGVTVVSVIEKIDTSTPIGKFMVMGIAFVAEQERETFRLRSEKGRRARVESGKPLAASRAPYGYQWRLAAPDGTGRQDKIGLDPNPLTAPMVQRIFRELSEGKSRRGVCVGLSADGIPTPTSGEVWDKSTITYIARQELYWGEGGAYRHAVTEITRTDPRTGARQTGTQMRLTDVSERVPYSHEAVPPLVTPEIARAAHERLAIANATAPRGNSNPETYLLRGGFVKCGHCGRNMICYTSTRRRNGHTYTQHQYRCASLASKPGACVANTIERHKLDAPVWELVTRLVSQPGIIETELQRLSSETNDPTAEQRAAVSAQLTGIDRKRAKLAQAIAMLDDEEASAPLLSELKILAKLASEGQTELASLDNQRAGWQSAQASMNALAVWCGQVAPRLDSLTHAERQNLLHVLGLKITVWQTGRAPESAVSRFTIDMLPFAKESVPETIARGCHRAAAARHAPRR